MPSTMVHLKTAYKVNSDSSSLYWIGNIAPDCINDREARDRIHFRGVDNRGYAMNNLAEVTPKGDPFSEGILLHLFLDWKWDNGPLQNYIHNYGAVDWFLPYRNEIGLLSAWLYNNTSWSSEIWSSILSYDKTKYGKIIGASPEDIFDKLHRANKFHIENKNALPDFFTPLFVENFTDEVANEYKVWRSSH